MLFALLHIKFSFFHLIFSFGSTYAKQKVQGRQFPRLLDFGVGAAGLSRPSLADLLETNWQTRPKTSSVGGGPRITVRKCCWSSCSSFSGIPMSSTLTASSFADKVSAKELTAVTCSMQNLTHLFPEQEAEDAIINMN